MSTTPTALDDLLSLLSPEEQAVIKITLLKNDKAKAMLDESLEVRKAWLEQQPPVVTPPEPPTPVTPPTPPPVTPPAPAPPPTADLSAITRQLTELNTSLTGKLGAIEKDMVKKSDVNSYRGEILATAIKNADLTMQLRAQHAAEFPSEPFDLAKLQAHLDAKAKEGRVFKDITEVYNDLYGEKRIQARIDKGIADGIKQKNSGAAATVASGGSGSTALSAAQQALKTYKGDGGTNDHVLSMADKLRKIREARESVEAGVQEAS